MIDHKMLQITRFSCLGVLVALLAAGAAFAQPEAVLGVPMDASISGLVAEQTYSCRPQEAGLETLREMGINLLSHSPSSVDAEEANTSGWKDHHPGIRLRPYVWVEKAWFLGTPERLAYFWKRNREGNALIFFAFLFRHQLRCKTRSFSSPSRATAPARITSPSPARVSLTRDR